VNKVLTYIGIALVIVISVVALFNIDEAVKITVNAIIGVMLVGVLIAVGKAFTK